MKTAFRYHDNLEMDLLSYDHDNEKVDTAIQTLESLTYSEELLTDGDPGLDDTAYKLVQHSVEAFLRLGKIGQVSDVAPSLERFKPRYDVTQATLEGLGEGIKNVFMSIINAIKSAFSWIWGLIKKLFGRGKDREEKIESMKHEAEEIKQKAQANENTPAQEKGTDHTDSGIPRTPDGWFTKVELSRPEIMRKLVNSNGFMSRPVLDKITTEMVRTFEFQGNHNRKAFQVANDYKPENEDFHVPFGETHDSKIISQLGKRIDGKVYASLEFGEGEHIVVVVPNLRLGKDDDEKAFVKNSLKWADGLTIRKVKVGGEARMDGFRELEGDMCNGDKLIDIVQFLNKMMMQYTDKLKSFQDGKERFIKTLEANIKKEGTSFWSSADKKLLRDEMMYQLKYFRKTMDEPALSYFGLCDGIVGAYINLATYVLHFNRTNGNKIDLKKEDH